MNGFSQGPAVFPSFPVILLCLGLMLTAPVFSFAAGPVPVLVKETSGAVQLTRARTKEILIAKAGDAVLAGDTVETLGNSYAVIAFRDTGEIRLSENSRWILEKAEAGPEKSGILSELALGELRAKTRKLTRGARFQVRTPTSVAAVRGTEFGLRVYYFGGTIWTRLEVYVGTVAFSNLDETDIQVVVAGETVTNRSSPDDLSGLAVPSESGSGGAGNRKAKEKIIVKSSIESEDSSDQGSSAPASVQSSIETSLKDK